MSSVAGLSTEPTYTFVCVVCGHALLAPYQVCGARCYHKLVAGAVQ